MNTQFDSLLEMDFAPLAEVKSKLSEKVRQTLRGKRVAITSHGRPQAVLLAYEDFRDLLRALENKRQELPPIDFQDWKKSRSQRKKISKAILHQFKPKRLTRKGQKKYKQDTLRGFTEGN